MGTLKKEHGPQGRPFMKASGFCVYTLNPALLFDCIFVCRTCGYMLNIIKDVRMDNCVSVISDFEINVFCPNCPEGTFNWRFCSIYNKIINRCFNGLCLRIMCDGKAIRDAWENATSKNTCDCSKMINYSMISWSREYPFLCANCTRFFFDEGMASRYNPIFGYLRGFQLNVARDYEPDAWFFDDINKPDMIKYSPNL